MSDKQSSTSDRIWKVIGWGILLLFVGSIFWSIWFDTLLPLVRAGDTRLLIFNLIGIPIILAGTCVFVYGGYVFVRDTFRLMGDEAFQERVQLIQSRPRDTSLRAARWNNMRALGRTWRAGVGWLAFGFLLIAVGGFLINQ